MMGRRTLVGLWLSLVLGALATLVAPGCGESGQTATCPDLSLYDINAAGEANSAKVAAERARAVDAGCMTDLDDASVNAPNDASPVPNDAATAPNDAAPTLNGAPSTP